MTFRYVISNRVMFFASSVLNNNVELDGNVPRCKLTIILII